MATRDARATDVSIPPEPSMFTNSNSAIATNHSVAKRNSQPVVSVPSASMCATANDWLDHWNGPVIATATAVGALVLSEQHGGRLGDLDAPADIDSAYQGDLSELIVGSMHWLARRQHTDGGWDGLEDDRSSPSDLLTTMMVRSTFQLTGAPAAYPDLGDRMVDFVKKQGNGDRLKSIYGPLHSATLLARGSLALAEVVDWKQLPAIPVETATSGSRVEFWDNRQPVLPALVALGIASCAFNRPLNPITNWRRSRSCRGAVEWLADKQAADGSFEGSVPVTSVVLMSLASVGHNTEPIVRRGVEYLFAKVRGDGSWGAADHGTVRYGLA